MGKNQKNRKSIDSLLRNTEEHFVKIQEAIKIGDMGLYLYYIKEIELHFFQRIGKLSQDTPLDENQKELYLLLKKQFDEIKTLSWN